MKSKMLMRKTTLNGSGLKRRIIDLLWLMEEEGEGEKAYFPVDRCSPKSK